MSDPTEHKVFMLQSNSHGSFASLPDSNWVQLNSEARDLEHFKQLWLMVDSKIKDDTGTTLYKLRCLKTKTDLQISVGYAAAQANSHWAITNPIHGSHSQLWKLTPAGAGYNQYFIQNYQSGNYLDIITASDNVNYVCCNPKSGEQSQIWFFDRRSRSSKEIKEVLGKYEWIESKAFNPYAADGAYINLPYDVRQSIWEASSMGKKYIWRSEIFDCDDFAINMKAEVAKWGYDNIKTDDVSILMGILWGNSDEGGHAFNWYLSPDLQYVMLYEPQVGKEENKTTGEFTGMNLHNYKVYFGLF